MNFNDLFLSVLARKKGPGPELHRGTAALFSRLCLNHDYQWSAVYLLPVCFRIPSPGTGTKIICSRRASTASKSLFRATSTGIRKQTTDCGMPHRYRRVSSSSLERKSVHSNLNPFFSFKTCTYFILPTSSKWIPASGQSMFFKNVWTFRVIYVAIFFIFNFFCFCFCFLHLDWAKWGSLAEVVLYINVICLCSVVGLQNHRDVCVCLCVLFQLTFYKNWLHISKNNCNSPTSQENKVSSAALLYLWASNHVLNLSLRSDSGGSDWNEPAHQSEH